MDKMDRWMKYGQRAWQIYFIKRKHPLKTSTLLVLREQLQHHGRCWTRVSSMTRHVDWTRDLSPTSLKKQGLDDLLQPLEVTPDVTWKLGSHHFSYATWNLGRLQGSQRAIWTCQVREKRPPYHSLPPSSIVSVEFHRDRRGNKTCF